MRRPVLLVVVAFVVTRLVAGGIADHPEDVYPARAVDPSVDTAVYEAWAEQMQDLGRRPYGEFEVEYPPGALVMANVPYALAPGEYQPAYIVQSLALDALGLFAVVRLALRRSSWWGVGAWLVLIPLLGPVAYTRLDIAAAAAVAWALERAEARRWLGSGAWLGVGIVVKATPVLVLPAMALVAPRRWLVPAAAAAVAVGFTLPFLIDVGDLVDQVAAYHLDRGVHAESLWGSLALTGRVLFDADVDVVSAFGAVDISASWAGWLESLSTVAAVAVLAGSVVVAARRVRPDDGAHLAVLVCATLTLLTAVGSVFSPQYLVWVVAAMAMALTVAPRAMRWPAVLLGVAVALAHLIYPVFYDDYVLVRGAGVPLGLARNLALLAAGVLAAREASRFPAVEEEEVAEPVDADLLVGPQR